MSVCDFVTIGDPRADCCYRKAKDADLCEIAAALRFGTLEYWFPKLALHIIAHHLT